jgi:PilZ domain
MLESATTAQERRRSPREDCDHPIRVVTKQGPGDYVTLAGQCFNRSDNGFAAHVAGTLEMGKTVGVEFQPGLSSPMVQLQAEVVHISGSMHGFKFFAPSDTQRIFISKLFREC